VIKELIPMFPGLNGYGFITAWKLDKNKKKNIENMWNEITDILPGRFNVQI